MKFALVDGLKTEAVKGAQGICPNCGSGLIAKCGEVKINHWAHKGIRNCDPWWENETDWHRAWKNNFPATWQEISLHDERTGEKHIADLRTSHGLVIEFQHSNIDPQERGAREKFYKNMVWVVDGTRLKRDYPRFVKEKKAFRPTNLQGIHLVDFPDECFSPAWLRSSVPVIFDFRGTETIDDVKDPRSQLYCLLPVQNGRYSVLQEITHGAFVETIISGEWLRKTADFIATLIESERIRLSQTANQFLTTTIRRRESQYFVEGGRWKKKRRL